MARILLVGTATLDLVFDLDHHPGEDEEMRARALRTCRGGNAANSAVVLSALGHQVEFLGVLAEAAESAVIERDFDAHGVAYHHCPRMPGRPPTSSIYLSGVNRSIVHYRDLPEMPAGQLDVLDLSGVDWIHFEARNLPALLAMIQHVRNRFPKVPVSVELEKPREGFESLLGRADLMMCSRGIAAYYGQEDPRAFLADMSARVGGGILVAAWGERGAFGVEGAGVQCESPASAPGRVVDTLGAGDTFNAGVLHGMTSGWPLEKVLSFACKLAGRKCGSHGFDFLRGGGLNDCC